MLTYSSTAIDDRLLGTVAAIDAGGTNGRLKLFAAGDLCASFELARPCGTVGGGVLTFGGTLMDVGAIGSAHLVSSGAIYDSNGSVVVQGLTAGISSQPVDIVVSTPIIAPGQVVQVLSMTITGAA